MTRDRQAALVRLWTAVFWQALRDLTPGETRLDITATPRTPGARQQTRQLRRDAVAWIYADAPATRGTVPLLTFAEVAAIIGVDPTVVRAVLRRGLVIGPWPLGHGDTRVRVGPHHHPRAVQTYPEEERAVGVAGR